MTIKEHKPQVTDKSLESYKINKKKVFWAKNGFLHVKNRSVNKDQEVRDQVSTIFLEAPNSGLIVGEFFFAAACLKFVLFQF